MTLHCCHFPFHFIQDVFICTVTELHVFIHKPRPGFTRSAPLYVSIHFKMGDPVGDLCFILDARTILGVCIYMQRQDSCIGHCCLCCHLLLHGTSTDRLFLCNCHTAYFRDQHSLNCTLYNMMNNYNSDKYSIICKTSKQQKITQGCCHTKLLVLSLTHL